MTAVTAFRRVCTMMNPGWRAGELVSPSLFSSMQQQTTNMVIGMDELQCESGARSLADCSYSPWGSHNCDHSKDVALICGTSRKFSQLRQNIVLHVTLCFVVCKIFYCTLLPKRIQKQLHLYCFILPESDVDQRKSQLERQTRPQNFNPFQPQFPQFGMFPQFDLISNANGIIITDANLFQ